LTIVQLLLTTCLQMLNYPTHIIITMQQ